MCGIAGIRRLQDRASPLSLAAIDAMTDALVHRGPDGRGTFVDEDAGVALGHRRLSIVDLSETGRQPMVSSDGRFVIVFNGEIYNFPTLRLELEATGVSLRGHSDTEVLLETLARDGVARTLPRLDGMFAFALHDRRDRSLVLARDHVGIKPLYVARHRGALLFASELKGLFAHPEFYPRLDRGSLALYLRYGYVPAPRSILEDVEQLRPGTYLVADARGDVSTATYYSLRDVVARGAGEACSLSFEDATTELERLLGDSVARQMVADVPLGAFLSGGIDSSTIVALMQSRSRRPVRTFTIGFEDRDFDEAAHAKAIAHHLGTEHVELRVDPSLALSVVPDLAHHYDEPFADSSQIPTYLVSRMTREHVTVSLSGDGGDELFAGYTRHFVGRFGAPLFDRAPSSIRRGIGAAMSHVPDHTLVHASSRLPRAMRPRHAVERWHKVRQALSAPDSAALYGSLVAAWAHPGDVLLRAAEPTFPEPDPTLTRDVPGFVERMQYLDAIAYLPDDILRKVDRATMAVSLEARVPFLAPDVMAFAFTLPTRYKVEGRRGKRILRNVLARHVPTALFDRPKMGFAIPIGAWLRGPLREWGAGLLEHGRLTREGLLDADVVTDLFASHVEGRADRALPLYTILMLEAWLERWGSRVRLD